jgi:poly(3-hydroxybutyrate) depolymerase
MRKMLHQARAATLDLLYRATAVVFSILAFVTASAAEPRNEIGFGSNPGNLRMFSYIPAGLKTPAPLVVVLHGCKQKAPAFGRDAGWFELAESAGVMLLLPEQKGLIPYWYDNAWVAPGWRYSVQTTKMPASTGSSLAITTVIVERRSPSHR